MNEYEKVFNKFYNKLKFEGLLKSFGISCAVGAVISGIICLVLFLTGFDKIWIVPTVWGIFTLVCTLSLYFGKYRPTKKDVAKRVDMFGLKERMLSMVEMEGNDSFIAKKQREDTYLYLEKVKNSKLKLKISKLWASIATFAIVFGIIATTLTGISITGTLPTLDEIEENNKEVTNVNVAYLEGEGGFIEGEIFQVLQAGDDASEVVAVPEDGYMFDSWSDGVLTPERTDEGIEESFEVFAIFIEISEVQEPLDKKDDSMKEDIELEEDLEGPIPDVGGASKYEDYNQVIDGETYYRDVYERFYDEAIKILNEGGVVPEYIRVIIEDYYGVIK